MLKQYFDKIANDGGTVSAKVYEECKEFFEDAEKKGLIEIQIITKTVSINDDPVECNKEYRIIPFRKV